MRVYQVDTALGSVGNTEWWTDKDWDDHKKHVEQLKKEGRLGEIVRHKVMVEEHPLLDNTPDAPVLSSARMIILNLSE